MGFVIFFDTSAFRCSKYLFLGVDESPLMTWGEVDSTPLRLETTATPGPAFRFPEESERDRLTHKMVDENTKKNRFGTQNNFIEKMEDELPLPTFCMLTFLRHSSFSNGPV